MEITKEELITKLAEKVPQYQDSQSGYEAHQEAVTNVLAEAYDQGFTTGKEQTLKEVLKLIQEDIDFAAKNQQIVQTKAQAYVITQLHILSDQDNK